MDATLVETRKQEALYSYKKYRAYQPLITYWSEAELIVHIGVSPDRAALLRLILSERVQPRFPT